MNISVALNEVYTLIRAIQGVSGSYAILGEIAEEQLPYLEYVYEFAKTVREVPTTHDSKAESDEWDRFFEDIQKGTNG